MLAPHRYSIDIQQFSITETCNGGMSTKQTLKTMMKKIFTFILSCVALGFSVQVFAQTIYTYTDATGITWSYKLNGTNATLSRPANEVTGVPQPLKGWHDGTERRQGTVTGVITIPATVSDGANTYPVVDIEGYVFMDNGAKGFVFAPTSTLTALGQRLWQTYFQTDMQFLDMTGINSSVTYAKEYMGTPLPIGRNVVNGTFYRIAASILVYLPNGTSRSLFTTEKYNTPASGEETIDINFIIDGVCSYFKVYDQNISDLGYMFYKTKTHSVYVPHAFTAVKAEYDRVFSNTAGKAVSTLYLPYPTDLPTGMQAYRLIRKGTDENGDKAFCFSPIPLGTRLQANHPYLVRITDGQTHKLPVMHNVQVPATPAITTTAQTTADGNWAFYGTTETINNAAATAMNAYYLNGNKWWAVQNGVENDYIAAYRCFVSSPTGATPAKSFFMVIEDENVTPTDIRRLERDTEKDLKSGRHTFYSIDGKRIGNDYDALTRGQIYVVNGKKFYKF